MGRVQVMAVARIPSDHSDCKLGCAADHSPNLRGLERDMKAELDCLRTRLVDEWFKSFTHKDSSCICPLHTSYKPLGQSPFELDRNHYIYSI